MRQLFLVAQRNDTMKSIGVAIITHHAKHHLAQCLPQLLQSPLRPRVLVVNSSSEDGTVEKAQELGAETLVIPRAEFNHGVTREVARSYLNTDIVGMMTPDAYLEDQHALDKLVVPLLAGHASVAYARQIPHEGADFFESFPREYNYPSSSHIRGIEDLPRYGVYTFFCSDSCAVYDNRALESIGGFQETLLGEDTVAVAKLLRDGHKIAYVAEAVVKHSHRYEFLRSFDTGLARRGYAELLQGGGSDQKRGIVYFQEMVKRLAKEQPLLLPYACAHVFVKWAGYKIGTKSLNAPLWWKKALSSQDFYWNFHKERQS
jgi:rhamnosyltransferase